MKKNNLLNIITKRSFIISFIFAFALWIYTSLNSTYKTYISVPLSIQLPDNRAIENDIPKNITLTVQSTGWNIINLNLFNNAKRVQVDLTKKNLNDSSYIISRNDFLKGTQSLESVNIVEVNPEYLPINIGQLTESNIPVIPNIEIIPHKDFILVGTVNLKPDSIIIKGNEKLTRKIKHWITEYKRIENVKLPINGEIKLKDTLSEIIKLNRKTVEYYADIQQIAEYQIPDIEIIVRGGSLPKDSYLYPPQITVILQGGIKEIVNINKDKIAATIQINDILNDNRGILIPKIEAPSGFKVLKVIPEYIYHYKNQKINNLSQIR